MNNNITNLNTKEQDNNNISAVKQHQEKFKDVNFEITNTTLYKESQQARETALEDHIAGIPLVDTTIKIPDTKPDITKPEVTSSFNTRDEIMSKLGLMDENYNYTDTYTNYINNGGTPLPGYEYAHQELLNQERYDSIFQKVEDGTMSYDTALMEAYGRDILAAEFQIDVTSVAYWRNKFDSWDFSNTFSNQYLMDQVKQRAEQYHQARLAGEFSNSNTKDTQLATLVGQDLEMKKIRELFPEMDKLKDDIEDKDFMNALHNGQINAEMRMTQDSEGTWYYLHTDGELYKLDGQGGENHGTLKLTADGKFEGIDLNNSGLISFGRSTWTGFTGVFTGILDLGAIVAQSAISIATLGLADGDLGWDSSDEFFGWANDMDAFFNDEASWLVDTGYVDLNSEHISTQDVFNFAGSMIGTIAGTMALGGIMGAPGAGASKGSGLIGWGDDIIKAGYSKTGKFIKGTGTVLKWQTGNYGSAKGAVTSAQIWGRRVGAAGTANTKNFFNDYRKMSQQSRLYEDGASEKEILGRAFWTSTLNTIIDTAISGGLDDNQVQAYGRLFKSNPKLATLSNVIPDGTFKTFITSRPMKIAANSAMDFTGNVLTGALAMNNTLVDGKLKDFDLTINTELLARSAVNTLWYSTRGQIKDWNIGLETIGESHTKFLNKLDIEIAKHKGDAETIATLTKVKQDYIDTLNKAEADLYEGKILIAMDEFTKKLGKNQVPDILKDTIKEVANAKAVDYYKQLYNEGLAVYTKRMDRINKIANPGEEDSTTFFKLITRPFKVPGKAVNWLVGNSGADKNAIREQAKSEQFTITMMSLQDVIMNPDSLDDIEKTEAIIKENYSKKNPLKTTTGFDLKNSKKVKDQQLYNELSERDPEAAYSHYFILPNEYARNKRYTATEAAISIMDDLGYISKVDGYDYIFKVQPYFDQLDFVNSSVAMKLIHNTTLALATEVDVETKTTLLKNLAKGLMDDVRVSASEKSAVLSRILMKLTKTDLGIDSTRKNALTKTEAEKIFMALQEDGTIIKLNKSADKGAMDDWRRLNAGADILIKLQHNKEKLIDITDPLVKEWLDDALKDKSITQKEYDSIMSLAKENPDFFQVGNQLNNKQKFLEQRILNETFLKLAPVYKGLSEKGLKEAVDLYLKEMNLGTIIDKENIKEKYKNEYAEIKRVAELYDNITKSTKTVTIGDDNIVYIDLSNFRGKSTNNLIKDIELLDLSVIKRIENSKEYRHYEADMFKELKALNKYINKNGSLMAFDLNTDVQILKDFLKEFNYDLKATTIDKIKLELNNIEGVKNFLGDTIVLDIPKCENINELKEAIKNGHLRAGELDINFREYTQKDIRGNSLADVDFERAILDQVEVTNIDPRIKVTLKQAPLIQLYPFLPVEEGKFKYTVPMATALLGGTESLEKLSGKMARQTAKQLEQIFVRSTGASLPIDKNLEKYFILDLLATSLSKNSHWTIPLSKAEADAFKKAGIVNYTISGKNKFKDKNNIWELKGNAKANNYMLYMNNKISDIDAIREYIVSDEFNVFRLLPMKLIENINSTQGVIDIKANYTTEGFRDLPSGLGRDTGLEVLSTRLPWDTGDNLAMHRFLKELIENNDSLEYNPIKGAGYTSPKSVGYNTYDEWYEAAKTSTNPYDIISKRYVDTYNNMIHGKQKAKKYNNETLLVREAKGILLEAKDFKATDDLVNKVKDYFSYTAGVKQYQAANTVQGVATPQFFGGREVIDGNVAVSPTSLRGSFGKNNLVITEGLDLIDKPTVQKALDIIKDIKLNEENDYRTSFFNDYIVREYVENNATKLLKGVAGSNGYIPITDVDEIAYLLAENYRDVADGTENSLRLNKEMEATAKYLWGNDYLNQVTKIFNAAQEQFKLSYNKKQILKKGFIKYDGPSQQIDGEKGYGKPFEEDENGNLIKPDTSNFNNMEKYLMNSIENKVNNPRNKYEKLMESTSELIDNEFSDLLAKRIGQDRLLYTSAPYASENQVVSFRHNSIGMMQTVLNTYAKLLSNTKYAKTDKVKENAMKLAVTVTNLNSGVDYAGETAKFLVVKDDYSLEEEGENLLDSYASANLKDLLYNIHRNKDKLKGHIIISTNPQDISNTAAIQMSFKKIETDDDFNNLVTDLYQNFILANAYYLDKDVSSHEDRIALTNRLLGGSIDKTVAQALLDNIPSSNMSTILRNRKEYEVFRERTGVNKLSKLELMSVIKSVNTIDANTFTREAVEANIENINEIHRTNSDGLSNLRNLSYLVGDPDYYSDEKRKALEDVGNSLLNKIPEESSQMIKTIANAIVQFEKPEMVDLIIRQRSLIEMKEENESGNIKKAFIINKDNNKIEDMDSLELKNIVNSLSKNDVTIDTNISRVIGLDSETGIGFKYNASTRNDSVFSIGLHIKIKGAHGWEDKPIRIYVNYETGGYTKDQWIKENIDVKHHFYKNNKGYRDEVEVYKNIEKYVDNETVFYLKPEEIKTMLSSYIDNKTLLVGYNSSSADLEWFKNCGFLNDSILRKAKHIDVKTLGDTSLAIESKTSGKKDVRAERYGISSYEAHGAYADAKATLELLYRTANTSYNIALIKNKAYEDIKEAVTKAGLSLDDSFTSALNEIDSLIKNNDITEVSKYFDTDVNITPETVTAATELFEFAMNKRMANMEMAIRDQEVKDNYYTKYAIDTLDTNSYRNINKLYAFAKEKGINRLNIIKAFKQELYLSGECSMNSLLEVLGNEARMDNIVKRLGLDPKEYDESTIEGAIMFPTNPRNDSELSGSRKNGLIDFDMYDTLKDTRDLYTNVKEIVQSLNITDTITNEDITNDLLTFYEFREGMSEDDIFKANIKTLDTKISRLYEDYLKGHYGNEDALISTRREGIYDLIDALPVGEKVKDLISGKQIVTDSSMIVISEEHFSHLTGMSLYKYKQEYQDIVNNGLYSQLLIHPADANNKILPRRIIVTNEPGRVMRVPETLIETLGARDFDGDHLILLRPDMTTQEPLRIYASNMYKIHNVQEAVLNTLRNSGVGYKNYAEYNLIINTIGKNKDVLELCRKADEALSKGEEPDTERFIKYIQENFKGVDIDKVLKDLWIKEIDLEEVDRSKTPLRYINNPAIYLDIDGTGRSYSGIKRAEAEAKQLVSKYQYAFIDQVTGMEEKAFLTDIKNKQIKNPWTDLLASGIYGSNTVAKYFDSYNIKTDDNEKQLKALQDTLTTSFNYITDEKASIRTTIKSGIEDIISNLKNENNGAAFAAYNTLLRQVEVFERQHLKSSELMNALTSESMLNRYNDLNIQIQNTAKKVELYNELARNERYFNQDSYYGDVVNYTINDYIASRTRNGEGVYNQNIFNEVEPVKGFVITRFADETDPIAAVEIQKAISKDPKKIEIDELNAIADEITALQKEVSKDWYTMPENPTKKDFQILAEKKKVHDPILDRIKEIKAEHPNYKNFINKIERQLRKQDEENMRLSYKPEKLINGIGEDSILYNNKAANEQVGYTRINYHIGEKDKVSKDIEVSKVYKKGTQITNNIKLEEDSYVAGITNKNITVIQVNKLDNGFKMSTDFGGKGVVNSKYSTEEDITFLLNKPKQDKQAAGYNKPLKTTERPIILRDSTGGYIVAYGYEIPDLRAIVTENSHGWQSERDRSVDLLHYVMDLNTLNGILDMGAKYSKEEGLTTNAEAYAQLRDSVYHQYKDQQIKNFLGTFNKLKISYIINKLSDEELVAAFKSKKSANELREALLNNMELATERYTSLAYTLGKKFKNKIDPEDPIAQKLFDDSIYKLLGSYKRSASGEVDVNKETSKSDISGQANLNNDNTSNLKFYEGKEISLNDDAFNSDKQMENLEDDYMSPFDFYRYMFGSTRYINTYKIAELMKEGKIPYGTFIANTANPNNGYRHWSADHTRYLDEPRKLLTTYGSTKTAVTANKKELVSAKPSLIDLFEPSASSKISGRQKALNGKALNIILDATLDIKHEPTNEAKIATMLYQLQGLKDTSSTKEKISDLYKSKQEYRVYDSHLSVLYDEEGNPYVELSKNIPLIGQLKDLKNAVKGSVYNYTVYNTLHNKEKDSLDYDSINKTVDRTKYKTKNKDAANKTIEKVFNKLKADLFNEETGEVKTDFNIRDYRKEPTKIIPAKVLSGGEKYIGEDGEIRKSVWGRQGLAEDTKLGVELTTAMKNQKAGAIYFEQKALAALDAFKAEATSRMSEKEIKEYSILKGIYTQYKATKDTQFLKTHLEYFKYNSIDEVLTKLNEYNTVYPEVAVAFNRWYKELAKLNEQVAQETGEPLEQCLFAQIAPYRSTSKELNKAKAGATIKNVLGLKKYDPVEDSNKEAMTLEFDVWNSSKAIIAELSKMHSSKYIKESLKSTGLLSNKQLLDKVANLIDTTIAKDEKYFIETNEKNAVIENAVLDAIYDLTSIKPNINENDYAINRYRQMYSAINNNLIVLIDKFNKTYNRSDLTSYTDFEKFSLDKNATMEQKEDAKTIANYYYAKILCGQGIIQSSKKFASELGSYIESLKNDGYCLVNAYGQKYVKGGVVHPFATSSLSNLVENMEIQYNSKDNEMWEQFVLEKIIRGEVYLLREDVANHLEKQVYTTKIPSNTMKTLKEISKWSSAFQMALPSKLLNRLISFTGFDYSMGIMYDPKVIKYIGPARRELLAAFQSKGTQLSDTMKEYMKREGQPIGLTGKDPVTFSEDLSGPDNVMRVLNKLTDPLEFQNHLGRYAIYLAALDGFKEGKPNYGPLYAQKEAIDALEKPEDKAMMVMDYMLGSPGGFPELSKKTSGLMLYATFPMNFARTMGAYGMSLGRLFKEGFNSENANYWSKTLVAPSMGLAAVTGASMLFTSLICDLFGLEEKEKEELVKDLSTIDIVGTIIGGTPTKSGSSMNPLENFNSMVIEPFTNTYNDTLFKKVFGVVNTNVLSHLNPAIKAPLEVWTGYDMFGSSLINTKHNYTNIENGIRKALGFFIGSSTANALVDQYKMDKYVEDRTFLDTLVKGTTKGISNSLGNQKTYKKDTTNYYNNIYAINSFNAKLTPAYDTEIEDYADAQEMGRIRNYSNTYGQFNSDDYTRISRLLKKMINNKEEPIAVYSLIIGEYNNGTSEATLRAVLNNNSLARKLNKVDKEKYLSSLSSKEYKSLVRALTYEKEMYPLLQEFFPDSSTSGSYYYPTYKKPYYYSGNNYKAYVPSPRYYRPSLVNYYPNNNYYNNKTKSYNPWAHIDRVQVNVSPEMAVWKNDFNAIEDPDRKEWYLDNPFYNNLSEYEKRQKGGN